MNKTDAYYMQQALVQAQQAAAIGEVPIGAVIVQQHTIIASGYNQSISLNDPSAHAEIMALRSAARQLRNYRLPDCDLYVTLEPCPMCAGSLIHARIRRVIFGAGDSRNGALGSVCNLMDFTAFNHHYTVTSGILAEPCSRLLKDFFKARR